LALRRGPPPYTSRLAMAPEGSAPTTGPTPRSLGYGRAGRRLVPHRGVVRGDRSAERGRLAQPARATPRGDRCPGRLRAAPRDIVRTPAWPHGRRSAGIRSRCPARGGVSRPLHRARTGHPALLRAEPWFALH